MSNHHPVFTSFTHIRRVAFRLACFGTILLCSRIGTAQVSPLTNAAPNVVFVPVTNTSVVVKHPALPVLYLNSLSYPRNLLTVQLGADGVPVAGSTKAWGDFFSTDTNDVNQSYTIAKWPGVSVERNLLYVGMQPNPGVAYHASSNRTEFAVIKLDAAGLPVEGSAKPFRVVVTAREQLIGMRFIPALNKLLTYYYVTSGFVNLGDDGLPAEESWTSIFGPINLWNWSYFPEWKRFFAMPPGPSLYLLALDSRNGVEYGQMVQLCDAFSGSGAFVVSAADRKLYALDVVAGQELVVLSLAGEGRITGALRRFALGPSHLLRADFRARRLYGISHERVHVVNLDAQGLPAGPVQSYPLACGYVWDAFADESTGKLYLGCQLPPVAEK